DAAGPLPTATPTAAPEPTPTPTPSPTDLVISAERPLRLYIGGDSMVEIQFGPALEDLADDTGMIEVLAIDYDRGSGLSRPDFVDWPARLAQVSADLAPDAMVVYFGGNDAQPLKIDGTVHEPEAPEWQAEYRGRVAALMDQLSDAGHHAYWMGLPIPRSEKMVTRFGILNAIYEEEAATRDAITFVPMWDVFADANGVYAEYLQNQNGDVVDMRLNDGIHFTTAGAYRAARPTIARIIEDFGIG
ncbi:MAG: SGNH/GDSL hydrolase family protein, partial [Nitriliruptorales bacterium]